MQRLIVEVFKSVKKEGAYLFLEKGKDKNTLPKVLLEQLGGLESTMVMLLTPEKKLAKTAGKDVLTAIADQGFYLQYSPEDQDEYMQQIPNSKMSR